MATQSENRGGVWLGVPGASLNGTDADAFVSRIGGTPSWLRPRPHGIPKCTACSSALSLLAQLHAPLDVFDRILYVFICTSCGRGKEAEPPPVVVLRSQIYNPEYDETLMQQRTMSDTQPGASPLFDMDDAEDWGDDSPTVKSKAHEPPKPVPRYMFDPPITPASRIPSKTPLVCLALDTMPEPRGAGVAPEPLSNEAVITDIESRCPGTLDSTADDDDDLTAHPDVVDEFVERLSRVPAQCVRWEPGGVPLVAHAGAASGPLPKCERCGAPRAFEFQIVSPIVFALCCRVREEDLPFHFSSILVFTCTANCYSECDDYVTEFSISQAEV